MEESDHLSESAEELRRKIANDGYLFFRGVIDRRKILKLREKVTAILAQMGWIEGGDNSMQAKAIGFPFREGEDGFFEALDAIVKLEELHALAHDSALLDLMKRVLGDTAFPHPLSIMRLVFPNNPEITTPPHQDYNNNQGTENLTAVWIPLSDCPIELGSLAVMKGSNKLGLLPLEHHLGPGNSRAVLPAPHAEAPWVTADFRMGDVLLFPALTVHSALENTDPSRMRLSVDFRYQQEGEALTEQCLLPHFNRISWEQIYHDWKSSDLQYYWRHKKFSVVDWENPLLRLPEDTAGEAYKQGIRYSKLRKQRHAKTT